MWALRYLLDRGILSASEAVSAGPVAEDVSASHRSYRVSVAGQPRWLVKRADPVRSGGRDLGAEPALYRLSTFLPGLSDIVPECRHIEPSGQVVVLAHLPAETFGRIVFQEGEGPADAALRSYGGTIARLHDLHPVRFGRPPWLLLALEPSWGNYRWLPPPTASFLLRLRSSSRCRTGFGKARRAWRATSLIHGDIRWANALVQTSGNQFDVRLVDWELACVGDPAWDIGSALADIIAAKAFYDTDGDLRSAFRWCELVLGGYWNVARPAEDAWRALMRRSARLAGIRLVQTVIEHGHESERELRSAEAVLAPWVMNMLDHASMIGDALAADARGAQP